MRSLKCVKASKCIALLAAMAFALAAARADTAAIQEPKLHPLVAAAEEAVEEATDETAAEADTTKIIDDCYGEVVMYRWTQMTYEDAEHRLPEDNELHPVMMIWHNGYYFAGKAPDCIWSSENSSGVVPGIDKTHYMPSISTYKDHFEDDGDVEADETFYIDCRQTYGDTQINPASRLFYTSDDRNVPYMHYTGKKDGDNHNEHDNSEAILTQLKLKSDNGTEYWLHPENDECMTIRTSEPSDHPFRFEQDWRDWGDDNSWGLTGKNYDFDVAFNRKHTDGLLYIKVGFGHVQSDWSVSKPLVYLGEKLRFSAINGGTTVGPDSILSITPGRYISDTGEGEPATGVILPEGQTLTIEKGGVLSVSGQFINNGTIINYGTILIRDGGSIYPFLQGNDTANNGCGKILCSGGDIIIKEGGALFAGLQDEKKNLVPFRLDNGATLVNMGLMVYGGVQLGSNARVELYDTSVTYGGIRFSYALNSGNTVMWSDYQKMEAMPSDYINQLLNVPDYQFTEKVNTSTSYHCCGNMYQTYTDYLAKSQKYGFTAKHGMYRAAGVGSTTKYHVIIQEGAENRLNDPFLKDNGIVTETMGI
ncbi:MAG: hypothetical protein IJ825_08100 [Oscillospiraceae bacterium]|nr:hypothetical protein [Oscillospiraceae bacterium]